MIHSKKVKVQAVGRLEELPERVRVAIKNAEENAYINLLADVNGFYEKWGFKATAPNSVGMFCKKTND